MGEVSLVQDNDIGGGSFTLKRLYAPPSGIEVQTGPFHQLEVRTVSQQASTSMPIRVE